MGRFLQIVCDELGAELFFSFHHCAIEFDVVEALPFVEADRKHPRRKK